MRKIAFGVLLVFLSLTLLSCNPTKCGGMAPIQFDKYELRFPKEGGEQVITSSNYSDFWIQTLEDALTGEYVHFPKSPAKMDGIEVKVEGSQLIITVSPSDSPRCWRMMMELRDAFSQTIWVLQR